MELQRPKANAKVGCAFASLPVSFTCIQATGQAPHVLRHVASPHAGHMPGSPEDCVQLRPDPMLEDEVAELLCTGLRPFKVRLVRKRREADERRRWADDDCAGTVCVRGFRPTILTMFSCILLGLWILVCILLFQTWFFSRPRLGVGL